MEILKRDKPIPSVFFYRELSENECAQRVRILAPGEFEDVILRPGVIFYPRPSLGSP